MRIDVLNTTVVLFLRYLYSVKSYCQKNCALSAYPAREIFGFPTPPPQKNNLNNDLWPMGMKFAQDRELLGPHLPTKFNVSRWPRSQSQGGSYQPPPPGRPRYGKGPCRARVKWRRGIFGIFWEYCSF